MIDQPLDNNFLSRQAFESVDRKPLFDDGACIMAEAMRQYSGIAL